MAQELQKIAKKKVPAPIVRRPDDPAAKFRSHDEQVKINALYRKALQAGEEAKRRVMAEANEPEVNEDLLDAEKGMVEQKQLLKTLSAKAEELAEELMETAPGEQRPVKSAITKNKKAITRAENTIADLEEALEDLKS